MANVVVNAYPLSLSSSYKIIHTLKERNANAQDQPVARTDIKKQ